MESLKRKYGSVTGRLLAPVVAVAVAASLSVTGAAHAGSVLDVSTGVDTTAGQDNQWSVAGPVDAPSAYVLDGHPNWVDAGNVGDGSASWIGPTENADNNPVDSGQYVYSNNLGLEDGKYRIFGEYSSDNAVVDILFNGQSIFEGAKKPSHPQRQFETVVEIDPFVEVDNGSMLQFVVRNDTQEPSPTGFVLQGSAVSVPTPSAAVAGMGLFGLVALRRRRRA